MTSDIRMKEWNIEFFGFFIFSSCIKLRNLGKKYTCFLSFYGLFNILSFFQLKIEESLQNYWNTFRRSFNFSYIKCHFIITIWTKFTEQNIHWTAPILMQPSKQKKIPILVAIFLLLHSIFDTSFWEAIQNANRAQISHVLDGLRWSIFLPFRKKIWKRTGEFEKFSIMDINNMINLFFLL